MAKRELRRLLKVIHFTSSPATAFCEIDLTRGTQNYAVERLQNDGSL